MIIALTDISSTNIVSHNIHTYDNPVCVDELKDKTKHVETLEEQITGLNNKVKTNHKETQSSCKKSWVYLLILSFIVLFASLGAGVYVFGPELMILTKGTNGLDFDSSLSQDHVASSCPICPSCPSAATGETGSSDRVLENQECDGLSALLIETQTTVSLISVILLVSLVCYYLLYYIYL